MGRNCTGLGRFVTAGQAPGGRGKWEGNQKQRVDLLVWSDRQMESMSYKGF